MSHDYSFDAKDAVRRAVDIVDLVGQYLQLRRSGRNYVALCPWHDDSRPSLQVNPERQSFKCWVCDIGGDAFSFVMKMENVPFPEALQLLADRAGITLPKRGAMPGAPAEEQDTKRRLYQVMAWAAEQYHRYLLESPEAAAARAYLEARGIQPESVRKYQLGFAPDRWSWLLDRASANSVQHKYLEAAGLAVRREGASGFYDRFRGRVLFTIRDPQGRPVALGGRILPEFAENAPAKYINSPETPLFSKSSLVYGLDVARDAITKSKRVLVMEGYTDTIVAHQCGFANTVAVLGTALGERHIRLLRRYAEEIVLVLDGDEAGQRRTNEVLELFVANEVNVRVLALPQSLDPCDFLQQRGAAPFSELLERAADALEHQLSHVTRLGAARGAHAAHQAVEEILGTLAKAPRLTSNSATARRLREEQVVHRLARVFELPEDVLRQRLATLRDAGHASSRPTTTHADTPSLQPLAAWERELLELLVGQPSEAPRVLQVIGPDHFESATCREIVQVCHDVLETEGQIDFQRLLLEFDEPEIKSLLVDLDEAGQSKTPGGGGERLEQVLQRVGRRLEDDQRRERLTALRERRVDDQEGVRFLLDAIEQGRARHCISDSTDG